MHRYIKVRVRIRPTPIDLFMQPVGASDTAFIRTTDGLPLINGSISVVPTSLTGACVDFASWICHTLIRINCDRCAWGHFNFREIVDFLNIHHSQRDDADDSVSAHEFVAEIVVFVACLAKAGPRPIHHWRSCRWAVNSHSLKAGHDSIDIPVPLPTATRHGPAVVSDCDCLCDIDHYATTHSVPEMWLALSKACQNCAQSIHRFWEYIGR
eukprot:Gregarina_sp_Poly_1__238@NODE_1055_length_5215_cov_77_719891_g733_i0_p4_GENE_NODE_1055_length_5215_cov_77_719891_g733_i0NODE_1055_length_5215_cov_77_719891_g733_i0_p4_ORF_typecomplete_len211_score3_33zfC4H2/PF10146_9/0_13_NODE_1055_length_5215_cov_77_719891_g733_i06941326